MELKFGKVKISLGFLVMIALLVLLDGTVYMFYILGSVFAHELAHILAIRRVNGRISAVTFKAFRICIELPNNLISYRDEIWIAFAGPLTNLCILGCTLLVCLFYKSFPGAIFLCATNLALFLLNMLPVEFLDGGRMLKSWLLTQMEPDTAERICGVISGACIFPLLAGGILLLSKTGYNLSLLVIAVYLLANFLLRVRRERHHPVEYALYDS